jgi:hypothetical protein
MPFEIYRFMQVIGLQNVVLLENLTYLLSGLKLLQVCFVMCINCCLFSPAIKGKQTRYD